VSPRIEKADVFVIGGGPAGLAAAIAARRKGFSVTVADGAEPPIDKACGEGLMPGGQAALRDLGVQLPADVGFRFRGIQFVQGNLQVASEFPAGQGIGIRRTLLHEFLINEAEKRGINLLWKTPVAGIEPGGVRLPSGLAPARWIIGADGSNSRVRLWSDLNATAHSSQRFARRRHYRLRPWTEFVEIYWGPHAQAYVTPISHEEVCIVVMSETAKHADFSRALETMPELHERLASAELQGRERGAITAMQSLKRGWRDNVALVGDASGGVDAITGEGMRLAFRQSLALADAMQSGDLREYGHAHWKLARRPFWMGELMLQLGRNSTLRSRALQMLSANPKLFARMLAIHVGQATPGAAVLTGAQLGWQFLAT